MQELNYPSNNDIEYKIVTNTKDTIYIALNNDVLNEMNIRAGIATSSAGSIGSLGSTSSYICLSTAYGTVASMSTLCSVSSAGSVGSVGSIAP